MPFLNHATVRAIREFYERFLPSEEQHHLKILMIHAWTNPLIETLDHYMNQGRDSGQWISYKVPVRGMFDQYKRGKRHAWFVKQILLPLEQKLQAIEEARFK